MAKRKNVQTAGRLVRGVIYTVPTIRDEPEERAEKSQISTAAREAMNLKYSWQKLELVLAANFSFSDLVLTLTYDDEHLPPTKEEAVKRLKKWIAQLRAYRKARDDLLRYVYVTEQLSAEGGRIHHHIVINGTGEDYEIIRSLWTNGADVEISRVDGWADGYMQLAKYLTKEPRIGCAAEVGARVWVPSIGLRRAVPDEDNGFVSDCVTLTLPVGAIALGSDYKRTEFGEYQYIKYLLPERKEPVKKRRPPRVRRRK